MIRIESNLKTVNPKPINIKFQLVQFESNLEKKLETHKEKNKDRSTIIKNTKSLLLKAHFQEWIWVITHKKNHPQKKKLETHKKKKQRSSTDIKNINYFLVNKLLKTLQALDPNPF